MWKPPVSDKPADVHVDSILCWEDAVLASSWLSEKIELMEQQIKERGDGDPDWLRRVTTAVQRSISNRNRLNHIAAHFRRREKLSRQVRIEEAFMNAVLSTFLPEDIADIWQQVWDKYPNLNPNKLLED